ncbi:acyl carrier protein phosphodiesterase [Membranihabitans marinus]|uniref:acyl carrier protein phosphodiesterase n=1 Tax=Membranihabitans marinus TaxID=1227546 RepID=UPI001F002645|nr:ACP phosphodiesterase [Membranihabitans marinus]
MNYLAHLFLSDNQDDLRFSNFLTDMMTIKEVRALPEKFQKGVNLHRFIDEFTDQHPINKELVKQMHPYFKKYASVVLDVFFDYFLFENWSNYSTLNFSEFSTMQYDGILNHKKYIPIRLEKTVMSMVQHQFLNSYTSVEGIDRTFERIDKRAKFETGFYQASNVMMEMKQDLNREFNLFFPELLEACHQFINIEKP